MPRSAAASVARAVAGRFREGVRALRHEDWRAWKRLITIGAAAMFGLMVLLRIIAERALDAGMLDFERDWLLRLGESGAIRFSTAVFLQTFGSDITLVILIVLTAGIAAWARRPITALSILLAAIVPDIVGRFGWAIWSRARPYFLHDGIASPGFHSFPSGHTSKTVAVYGLLTLIWWRASSSMVERGIALLALGFIIVAVPIGRMAMGVHWPSDVIGGAVIGGVWVLVLGYGLRHERTLFTTESQRTQRFVHRGGAKDGLTHRGGAED